MILTFSPLSSFDADVKCSTIDSYSSLITAKPTDINSVSINSIDVAIKSMQNEMQEINKISSKKEWFLAYKQIIEKYKNEIDPPETIYDYYNKEELNRLFGVVQAEVGDEYSFEQKCNVASVIFNRLEHQRYPDEIKRVLIKRQFSTISDGRYKQVVVSEQTILACEYVFSIMNTAKDCLFFDSNGKLKYDCVFNDEAHNFYRLKGEKRMEEIRISLKTAESIRKFVQTTREFESDVDICVGDRAVLDAKSILGLYSIDLTRILTVRIMSDNEDEIKKFTEKMEEFASE